MQSIPFPTITICPQTKSKKSFASFEHYYRRYFENTESHGKSYTESIFFETLLHVCDPQLVTHLHFNLSIIDNSDKLVPQLKRMLYTLDDSFMMCKWRHENVDCGELFNQIITDQGICFAFNMLDHQELFQEKMFVCNYRE